MRHIHHPGPAASQRSATVAGSPVPLRFRLDPGLTVDAAVAKGFADAGCAGGIVFFQGGRFEPFRYVMPAASSDPHYAAWYSETFEPAGPVTIPRAAAIVGVRDGKPFLHCHGIWDTAEGPRMGHMLAPMTAVAEAGEVRGIGFREATFEAVPDLETNFTLFEPKEIYTSAPQRAGAGALLAKVRPNQDISLAIEEICSRHGITTANIYGIGSLNGVRFVDGTEVPSYATEVLIREGSVRTVDAQPRARLVIDVVDMDGGIFSGELVRGDNPVCVTFELVIEVVDA
jgi:predicted DNA-binding protein with PD1-like motif